MVVRGKWVLPTWDTPGRWFPVSTHKTEEDAQQKMDRLMDEAPRVIREGFVE